MTQKRWTAESCHTIGYGWVIRAPDTLDESDIEAMQEDLCDYTDEPSQNHLETMLDEGYFSRIDETKLAEFKKVTIQVESCHRETFTQSLREESNGS